MFFVRVEIAPKAWISLDSFSRIGAFQWVTANPNKKMALIALAVGPQPIRVIQKYADPSVMAGLVLDKPGHDEKAKGRRRPPTNNG
jgi:hypothetical protein